MSIWKLTFRLLLFAYCLISVREMGAERKRMDKRAGANEGVSVM